MDQTEGEPSFDFDHLARAVGGDRDMMRHFAAAFADHAALYVQELGRSLGVGENEWAGAAHKLKGAAATVGAHRLAALCAEAEALPAAGDARARAIGAIEAELDNLGQILDNWLSH